MDRKVAQSRCPERRRPRWAAPGLIVAMVLAGGCGTSSRPERERAAVSPRRTFVVREITVEQGVAFLSDLGLPEVTPAPEFRRLLSGGTAEELEKAAIVLDLVDVNDRYVIRPIAPAAAVRTLPSNEQIATAIGEIAIGTFAAPPERGTRARAIIDIHQGAVLAIVPARLWPDIRAVIESGGKAARQRRTETPKDEPNRVAASAVGGKSSDSPAKPASPDIARERTPPESPVVGPTREPPPSDVNQAGPETAEQPQPEPAAADSEGSPPAPPSVGRRIPSRTKAAQTRTQADSEIGGGSLKPQQKGGNAPGPVPGRLQVPLDNGDDVLELSLPEKVNLVQLIDLVGEYLHLDCVYDAEKIGSQVVTLKLHSKIQSEMRVRDLYSLLETILKFKGLVMTRHEGNLVTIVPAAEVMDADPQLVDPNMPSVQAGDVVVTRVFRLRHVEVSSVTNLLQTMKLGVAVSPIEENQTLFITCYAQRMGRIAQLIEMVDKPGEPKEFRFRQLKYTVASTLAQKILGLAQELRSIPITIAAPVKEAPEGPSRAVRRLPSPSGPAPAPPPTDSGVYLDVDERTNRVLMVGLRAQLATVEELIEALDIPEQDVRTLSVYAIKHLNAADVMTKLGDLGIINKPAPTKKTPARGAPSAEPVAAAQETPTEELQAVLLETLNALLVNATREQHHRIQTVIECIDKSPQDLRVLRVYHIQHAEAADVMDKLKRLKIIEAAGESGERLTAAAPAAPATPGKTAPAETETPPQAVVLETANSLLVRATEGQHAGIEATIRHIDIQPREETIPYEIYFLENQDPEQLAEVLGKLVQETVKDKEGKIEKVVPKTQDQIVIVPDKTTYSLIVYASRKNQEWITKLVRQLDKRRPQVLIDCTLVEVTKSDAFSYDLNVLKSAPDLGSTSPITGVEPNVLGKFVQWGSGSLSAFYADNEVQALLTAMQSKNYGRVLAKPKLLVNDNQQGKIETKDTTYVEISSSIPVNSGAAGNQTSLVQTSVNYSPYEAGITLDITPHISEGDMLRLDIVLTRSDFLKSTATKPPNTRSNKVDTAVTLPDGSTVILGGLMKMNQNKGGSKIPILGDIPLFGGLFRSINNEDTQSKLYVFVKAEIIRPAEPAGKGMDQLTALSERDRSAFERSEQQFQAYEDWPGVKPKPVEPAKVLETH
jgi:type II secretory pathway component GspD/PulD (secretin)